MQIKSNIILRYFPSFERHKFGVFLYKNLPYCLRLYALYTLGANNNNFLIELKPLPNSIF